MKRAKIAESLRNQEVAQMQPKPVINKNTDKILAGKRDSCSPFRQNNKGRSIEDR